MVTKVVRVAEIFRDAQTYLHQRVESTGVSKRFEKSKEPVKKWLKANGVTDDEGNLIYRFPRNVVGGDNKVYSGVMLRKSVGQAFMVEDEVRDLLKEKTGTSTRSAAYRRVFKTMEVLQPDEVYVLQQEGLITEAELRLLLHEPPPSYALWPIEATEDLEGDDA